MRCCTSVTPVGPTSSPYPTTVSCVIKTSASIATGRTTDDLNNRIIIMSRPLTIKRNRSESFRLKHLYRSDSAGCNKDPSLRQLSAPKERYLRYPAFPNQYCDTEPKHKAAAPHHSVLMEDSNNLWGKSKGLKEPLELKELK